MSAYVSVLKPGLLTTIQDHGRWGWQSKGVPVAGAMDRVSFRLANALVGNSASDAALEVTLDGVELQFHDARQVAVTGAAFDVRVDGRPAMPHAPMTVAAGSRLRLSDRRSGARAYIAVSGGIAVPAVLGSRSTHLGARLGGIDGRSLRRDDVVPLGTGSSRLARAPASAAVEALLRRRSERGAQIRILPGPDLEWFDPSAVTALQSARYEVSTESNRMGLRLRGKSLALDGARSLISEGTVQGALQVPPDGQPIVLGVDRQTTGGYPTLAVVIGADLDAVGQLAPGDLVSFVLVDPARALEALLALERPLMALESSV